MKFAANLNLKEHQFFFTHLVQWDHYRFRQTFELGIFISTGGKGIQNLEKKFGCKAL